MRWSMLGPASLLVIALLLCAASADAMQRRSEICRSTLGPAIPACSVTVYLGGTTTKATIYGDQAGTSALGNPFTAGTNGAYSYYAANGRYTEVLSAPGFTFAAAQTQDFILSDPTNSVAWASGTLLNAKDFGAKGDGVTDDTAALQSALDTATYVALPNGSYKLSGALTLKTNGQRLIGQDWQSTILVQTAAAASALSLIPGSNGKADRIQIENLQITGPGAGSSTGDGIVASNPTYFSSWLQVKNVSINGFNRGLYFKGADQVGLYNVRTNSNNYGIVVDAPAANAFNVRGLTASSNTATGIVINGGQGGVWEALDVGSSPISFYVNTQRLVVVGSNFENASARHFEVATNGEATLISTYLLRGGGADAAPINVNASARVALINVASAGFAAASLVSYAAQSAVVESLASGSSVGNLSGSTPTLLADGAETWHTVPWNTKRDDGIPAATLNHRGMPLFVRERAASAADDRLLWYYRKADQTAASTDFVFDTIPQTLTNKTLTAPVLSGTVSGTYTLGGSPTFSSPTLTSPTLTGTVSGTPTWASTQDFPNVRINGSTTINYDQSNGLGFRNGLNSQLVRIYNTFTDASNYERLAIGANPGATTIMQEHAGTGSARQLQIGTNTSGDLVRFYTGGTGRFEISTTGHFLATTDNIYDVGLSGASRPRTGYFGTSLVVGTPSGADKGAGSTNASAYYVHGTPFASMVLTNASGARTNVPHMVQDTVTLTGGTAGVALAGAAAFTNSTSYTCVCENDSSVLACRVVQDGGNGFTVSSGVGADVTRFLCVGS